MRRPRTTKLAILCGSLLLGLPASGQNQLADESSPHLQEHADNLVDWYPWGQAAFAKAKAENKPLFVSIGYHSCHWCHRMMNESFVDPDTAAYLNENFVSVKVDREEFPEIDWIHMTYLQSSRGGGGWPLNVWLTPDLIPFAVESYLPPKKSERQPSFRGALEHIVKQWTRFPDYIHSQSRRDFGQLRAKLQFLPHADNPASQGRDAQLLAAYERLSAEFDPLNGGFGPPPRFPHASKLTAARFIFSQQEPDSFRAKQCLKMITLSLDKMAAGGIFDHLGGGFHRYATDPGWSVPRFEKMLGDQALIADAYLAGFRTTGNPVYLDIARRTLAYVDSTLRSDRGAYYASQHSDSQSEPGSEKLVEGAYYTWEADELAEVTGADAAILAQHFGVRDEGNAPLETLGASHGRNVLRIDQTPAEIAASAGLSEEEVTAAIARGTAKLKQRRDQRPVPAINRQIIISTNALMVSTLAKAFITTGDQAFLDRASETLNFIRSECFDPTSKVLYRISKPTGGGRPGVAKDYAFTVRACLDYYDASQDQDWLLFADALQKIQNRRFFDTRGGGFYNTTKDRDDVLIRLKSLGDRDELSPNSTSFLNLVRLAHLLDDEEYLSMARKTLACFRGAAERVPALSSEFLIAQSLLEVPPTQVIIVGTAGAPETDALIEVTRKSLAEEHLLILLDPSAVNNPARSRNAKLQEFGQLGGKATAHVCQGFRCDEPTSDPQQLRTQLTGK